MVPDSKVATMPPAASDRLVVDVISDVVCPWCWIGKRRLEAALALLAEREPAVRPLVSWHPFELNPDLPREGIARRTYVERKFGGEDGARGVYERIRAIGASDGIPFAFDAILRQPNTLDAHRLIAWAQRQGDAEPLVERLFRAFFVEGRSIGDRDTLAILAAQSGLDEVAARALLASGEFDDEVPAMGRRARELGVEGVPFFIFDGRVAVSGAQEPETLLDAIGQARSAHPD